MLLPTPQLLSQHFTNLIGRPVAFVRATMSSDCSAKPIFGIYKCSPNDAFVILKADRALLGSFAGALVGLPDSEVRRRLAAPAMDDLMSDAISEVLNVASSVVSSEGRTFFFKIALDSSAIGSDLQMTIAKPTHKQAFDVSVNDYQGGRFVLLY